MSLTNRLAQEIHKFRSRTNKSPSEIQLSEKLYQELVKEVEQDLEYEIEGEMNSYYGIPLKVSKVIELKIR